MRRAWRFWHRHLRHALFHAESWPRCQRGREASPGLLRFDRGWRAWQPVRGKLRFDLLEIWLLRRQCPAEGVAIRGEAAAIGIDEDWVVVGGRVHLRLRRGAVAGLERTVLTTRDDNEVRVLRE